MILLFVIISLFILYSLLIISYWLTWRSIPVYQQGSFANTIKISVIIPARNEEENIGALLNALKQQTYPEEFFEVLVIDDQSTDNTASIVRQFQGVHLITLKEENINSYKKKAIEKGIIAAKGELIITTDADCLPGMNWLKTIASFKEERQSVFIAAPVVFNNDHTILEIFQSLDFMILQGITGASVYTNKHSMCNGANLAYEKNAFETVKGFEGIDTIASGDDMLLMHKIWKQYPDKVHYLKSKDAIVFTQPMKTWNAFFNQRIRWASKASKYDDKRIVGVLLLVYLFNLSFLAMIAAGFFCYQYWLYLLVFWIAKTLVELPFVYSVATFFGKRLLLNYFFFFQPLHIVYTVFSGLLGMFGKYEWKGRKVK